MYMYTDECLTTDEYDRFMRIRDTGSSKARMCNEIAALIEKKKFYDQFRKALEDSKVQHSGHEDLLRLLMEKEIEIVPDVDGPHTSPDQVIDPNTIANTTTQSTTANQVGTINIIFSGFFSDW